MTLAQILASQPLLFAALAGFFGLFIGSFLNVVIYRLPLMMQRDWQQQCRELLHPESPADTAATPVFNLLKPDSHCPRCKHPVHPLANIPLLSWLALGGKCAHCKQPISARYPLIELVTGLLSAAVAWHFGFGWPGAGGLLLTWSLICLTMIDYDHQLLPDSITLPFLWLGLFVSLFSLYVDSNTSIVGALAGYLSLWTVYKAFKLLTGKEGMGYGDFKLLAMLGAWMGWQAIPVIVLLSSLVGAVVGLSLVALRKHERGNPIPFGPYLAAAGWISLLWGDKIIESYLTFSAN